MAGRLEQIEDMLKARIGSAFLVAHPEIPYTVHRFLLGHFTKDELLSWDRQQKEGAYADLERYLSLPGGKERSLL